MSNRFLDNLSSSFEVNKSREKVKQAIILMSHNFSGVCFVLTIADPKR